MKKGIITGIVILSILISIIGKGRETVYADYAHDTDIHIEPGTIFISKLPFYEFMYSSDDNVYVNGELANVSVPVRKVQLYFYLQKQYAYYSWSTLTETQTTIGFYNVGIYAKVLNTNISTDNDTLNRYLKDINISIPSGELSILLYRPMSNTYVSSPITIQIPSQTVQVTDHDTYYTIPSLKQRIAEKLFINNQYELQVPDNAFSFTESILSGNDYKFLFANSSNNNQGSEQQPDLEQQQKLEEANENIQSAQDKIQEYEELEQELISDNADNLDDLDMTNNTQILQRPDFLSTANWVKNRYEEMITNTPFEPMIMLSLSIGLALYVLGRINR